MSRAVLPGYASTGIPQRFQLMGHTINVRVVPLTKWRHGAGCVGRWDPNKHRIDVLAVQPVSNRQQIFCHELMHALFDMAGHDALSQDEALVDRMGHLLQQALTTFEDAPIRRAIRKEPV